MFRMIIVLYLICGTTGVAISSAPFRMPLQSVAQVSDMQRGIDRLVATGYRLLANKPGKGLHDSEFILIKDANSPVYRYTETRVVHADGRPAGRYAVLSEGNLGHATEIIVDGELRSYVPVEKEREATPPVTREGYRSVTAVPAATLTQTYELLPQNDDGAYLLGTNDDFVAMHPVNDYRVYRHESTDPRQRKIINTLTINGWNPYIVYRHTHIAEKDGKFVAAMLSEGRYPAPAVNDYAVEVFAAEMHGLVEVHYGNYNFYQDDDPRLEHEDSKQALVRNYEVSLFSHFHMRHTVTHERDYEDRTRALKSPLTLMRDAEVWNKYSDPLGAGVDKWKGRAWFNGYTKDELVLHEVSSSAIDRIGYRERTGELWVLFNEHGEYHSYQYLDVPSHIFNDFLAAESKGKYYNMHVKGKYHSLKY